VRGQMHWATCAWDTAWSVLDRIRSMRANKGSTNWGKYRPPLVASPNPGGREMQKAARSLIGIA